MLGWAQGLSQGIAGVINNLVFNSNTYEIHGTLHAPMNVEIARPNGATINWQVWCKAEATA